MAKIGIPRTLAYFNYYPFWKIFFDELGHEVVLSTPTTKGILDDGVKVAVNDACIPIKVYHGHVVELANKVDYLFCPRLVSLRKFGDFGTETFCPKFLGLPEMIRYGIENVPEIIDVRVNLGSAKKQIDKVCYEVGQILGNLPNQILQASKKASVIQKKYEELLHQEFLPEQALDKVFTNKKKAKKIDKKDKFEPELKIAVVGYPYAIYDNYINVGLLNILKNENVKILTQDMVNDSDMNKQIRTLPKSMFWYYSNRVIYGTLHFIHRGDIDGIIHVTAFACGPDSMVDRLLEIEARKRSSIPYMSVMIDEHSAEAGVRTRVEAFLDMIRYRRDKN
ncbi:Activator of (R)-2-hydroxyglutaryl-CoA dehydratase [Candidatus Syntrophocurvum alkaliphilum]|uniref:Activator of (R)-2-hydroxyglutaryl-CoA dehydratase n=1 Tax=Candidatus Syntrophocurvum alkaliphilum TaxID=2293317 RepID=A0A6I6DNC5_9FIRM|nr:acyl-CoA dehydratase activase-related protein [Candidatus Syntrophocurvum alkaliphilum]QGU00631.1 Activator of (R)-2-hydroxyglutaryl-CoA dehydratase [Candidatus Syntrophocurvum alkaliphilum]